MNFRFIIPINKTPQDGVDLTISRCNNELATQPPSMAGYRKELRLS